MKVGIIDFSSSGIALLVANIAEGNMDVLLKTKRPLSIRDYMKKGRLSRRGVEKIVEVMTEVKNSAIKVGAEKLFLYATASFSVVGDFEEVTAQMTAATGLKPTLLSGVEEAYADALANSEYSTLGDVLLVDIGGMTCQLADLTEIKRENAFSLEIGPYMVAKDIQGMYPDEEEAKAIRKKVNKALEKHEVFGKKKFSKIVMAGGNAEAIYSIYQDYYQISSSKTKVIKRKKLSKLIDYLLTSDDRSLLIIRNASEKVHVIVPAILVAYQCAKYFDASEIVVSPYGVKEGLVRLKMEEGSV